MQALHGGRLSYVPHVHGHLEAPTECFGVEEKDDGRLKLPADGGVHLRADHHHTLFNTPARTNKYFGRWERNNHCGSDFRKQYTAFWLHVICELFVSVRLYYIVLWVCMDIV